MSKEENSYSVRVESLNNTVTKELAQNNPHETIHTTFKALSLGK